MIGKFDCRVFCHISSLGDKISNTAATIQPNLFGFGKNFGIRNYLSTKDHWLTVFSKWLPVKNAAISSSCFVKEPHVTQLLDIYFKLHNCVH